MPRPPGTSGSSTPPSTPPSAPPVALLVRGLAADYGAGPVLTGADLEVPAGRILALLGPSGCGKTTLLRAIAGLERPTDGRVLLGERTLTDAATSIRPERRGIGMVFQDWALFPHMSVRRNVGFGLSRAERRAGRIEEALALVELTGLGERLPATLSGGQQQRVALARALATRPSLLLLDEPFSNLDTTLRVQVRSEVVRLLRGLGMTTVVVTHDQEEAFVLGDEVAVMLGGRIEQQATPDALYDAPASLGVAAFVGDANLLPGQADADLATTAVGAVPLRRACGGDVQVLVRPEDVLVTSGDEASVLAVEFYGHDAVYLVRTDAGATIRARILSRPEHRAGDRVRLAYRGAPTAAYAGAAG